MKSLKLHAIAWLSCICLGMSTVILVSYIYHNYREMRSQQKSEMKTLAKSIIGDLTDIGSSPSEEDYARLIEKYRYTDLRNRLNFTVFTDDKTFLFKSDGFDMDLVKGRLRSDERTQLYLLSVKSNPGYHHILSEWHFFLRYQKNGYIVCASDVDKYEVVESVQEGLILSLLATLAFIIPTGIFIKNKILLPLKVIETTVDQVREGKLDQRIPQLTNKDELAKLAGSMNATFMELETSFQRLQRFSSDAAHELRTPLTAIRGAIEVCLMKDRDAHGYREALEESLEEVIQLSAIVENLLVLSSPGSRSNKNFEPIVFSESVMQAMDHLERLPNYKNYKFCVQLNCSEAIEGNLPLLMRMCYNLIHNAMKYSEAGSEIAISTEKEDGQIVFAVKDQGVGITESDQDKIFDRFFQSDESHSDGAGLGLSIVKWIIECHCGTIAVTSTPGEGSLFSISLPITTAGGTK